MKMRVHRRDLEAVTRRLESCSPVEILKWVERTFGARAAILSSMQRAGSVLCHMADQAGISMVMTGRRHFRH